MNCDTTIQSLFTVLKSIRWRECEENSNCEWYYAENMHYVVHCKQTDNYWFVKAKSPSNAYQCVVSKIVEAGKDVLDNG